jgi:double-strand break repair protein MRE11
MYYSFLYIPQLNYFGKVVSLDEIIVKPLIFFKRSMKIAIYGIGYVEDYQLNKLLRMNKVTILLKLFEQVRLEDLDDANYNILVIHQNRFKGTHYAE